MNEKKTVLFPFDTWDSRVVQLWLEDLDRQGWALVGVKGVAVPRAKLCRRAGPPIRYCVDVAEHGLHEPHGQEAYLALRADTGWNLISTCRGLHVFQARPGTDPALALQRLWWEFVGPSLLSWAVLLVVLPMFLVSLKPPLRLFHLMMSSQGLTAVVIVLLTLPGLFHQISGMIFYLRARWGQLPPPRLKWIWLRRDLPQDTAQAVILRLGNTILRLEGPVDWSDPGVQAALDSVYTRVRRPFFGGLSSSG